MVQTRHWAFAERTEMFLADALTSSSGCLPLGAHIQVADCLEEEIAQWVYCVEQDKGSQRASVRLTSPCS